MKHPHRVNGGISRRLVLHSIGAAAIYPLTAGASAERSHQSDLIARAQAELDRLGEAIPARDTVGIADFARPSSEQRFHLIDMQGGEVASFLVAHGRGSDPEHTGELKQFSNAIGSEATSEGAYRTGDLYTGKYGLAMRLVGLDESNSNAEQRAIVIHGAWYVGPQMIRDQGRIGRSEGCLAFSPNDVGPILERLGQNRLVLCTRL